MAEKFLFIELGDYTSYSYYVVPESAVVWMNDLIERVRQYFFEELEDGRQITISLELTSFLSEEVKTRGYGVVNGDDEVKRLFGFQETAELVVKKDSAFLLNRNHEHSADLLKIFKAFFDEVDAEKEDTNEM